MFVKNLTFMCMFYIILIRRAAGQICVETKMGYRDVPETYSYTYLETYEKSFCLFWCTDTRVATAVGTRTIQKLVPEKINVCCEGYVKEEDENYDDNSIHCKPLCSPSCINGYCKAPGECACNPGYLPSLFDYHSCSPLCIQGCEHGTCTAPNICECDEGYVLQNNECEPICSEPCDYGTCVAPETCQCHPGYKKSENDICEPHCSSYTEIGECVVTITCEPGWTKVFKGHFEECEPECTEPCINGTCIAPDICECHYGFKKTDDDLCEPYCSVCEHGSCISPETCVCHPGWYTKEVRGICLPHCDHKCGNGTCVAPNVCDCSPGYKIDETYLVDEDTVCVPICDDCEGICVAPGQCMCELPQETVHIGADGEPCDCFNNCFNSSKKCEKTICLTPTTVGSINTFDKNEDIEEVTDPTNTLSTTDVDNDFTTDSHSDYNEMVTDKALWFNSTWFYVIGSTLIVIIIILMAIVLLKRKYSKFSGIIFNTHRDDKLTSVHYKQNCT